MKMTLKKLLIAFIATILVSNSLAHKHLDLEPLLQQQNLVMRQIMGRMMMNKSNQRGVANIGLENIGTCFNWYTAVQNNITTTYNSALSECVEAATEAKRQLSLESAEQRGKLQDRGHSICTQLTNCEIIEDALDFFTCYKTVGTNNSQVLYEISAGSEGLANNITVSYQHVDDTERVCTTTARNTYVTSLSNSATNLNNCLMGSWVPPHPTSAPTTSTTPTTTEETTEITSTTEEPTITTEEPTTITEEPTTITEGPTTTTEEPTTTTEEPTTTTEEPTTTTEEPTTTSTTVASSTEGTEPTEPTEDTNDAVESALQRFPEEDVYRYFSKMRSGLKFL